MSCLYREHRSIFGQRITQELIDKGLKTISVEIGGCVEAMSSGRAPDGVDDKKYTK